MIDTFPCQPLKLNVSDAIPNMSDFENGNDCKTYVKTKSHVNNYESNTRIDYDNYVKKVNENIVNADRNDKNERIANGIDNIVNEKVEKTNGICIDSVNINEKKANGNCVDNIKNINKSEANLNCNGILNSNKKYEIYSLEIDTNDNDNNNEKHNNDNDNNNNSETNVDMLKRENNNEESGEDLNASESGGAKSNGDMPQHDAWLGALATSAELETMSILYAKSVLDPAASNQLGSTRVALSCNNKRSDDTAKVIIPPEKPRRGQMSSEDSNEDKTPKQEQSVTVQQLRQQQHKRKPLAVPLRLKQKVAHQEPKHESPVTFRRPKIIQQNEPITVLDRTHQRKSCSDGYADASSSSCADDDNEDYSRMTATSSFAATHLGGSMTRRLEESASMVARFALSMPSTQNLHVGKSNCNSGAYYNRNVNSARQNAETITPQMLSSLSGNLNAMPHAAVYRPKVEMRMARRGAGAGLKVVARDSVGAILAHNETPTFRHSIRVNADEWSATGEWSHVQNNNEQHEMQIIIPKQYQQHSHHDHQYQQHQNQDQHNQFQHQYQPQNQTPNQHQHQNQHQPPNQYQHQQFIHQHQNQIELQSSTRLSCTDPTIIKMSSTRYSPNTNRNNNGRIYETIPESSCIPDSSQNNGRVENTVSGATDTVAAVSGGTSMLSTIASTLASRLRRKSPNLSSGSASSASVNDSGQGSAGSSLIGTVSGDASGATGALTKLRMASLSPPLPPRRQKHWERPAARRNLPGYIRLASCMDIILRAANALNSALQNTADVRYNDASAATALHLSVPAGERCVRELVQCAIVYVRALRDSLCAPHFVEYDNFESVLRAANRLQAGGGTYDASTNGGGDGASALSACDHFGIVARQMLEQSSIIIIRIICDYLNECSNTENLLLIAMEHLTQALHFGDDVCIDAIKSGAIERIVDLVRMPSTPFSTQKQLLRALALLCAISRGCLHLLAIDDGLSVIVRILCDGSSTAVADSASEALSIEAAGVLTQLLRPAHVFVRLGDACVVACVCRLLQLVDTQRDYWLRDASPAFHEALFICCASLANLSLRGSGDGDGVLDASLAAEAKTPTGSSALVAKLLYEQNAPRRLIGAVNALRNTEKGKASNLALIVEEQIVAVFSRMAGRGYSQALIAQGAIPFLLRIFDYCANMHDVSRRLVVLAQSTTTTRRQSAELCRRICYKAAVCLGILASPSAGLKALYESRGYNELCELLRAEQAVGAFSPLALICASLKQRLEITYSVESAV